MSVKATDRGLEGPEVLFPKQWNRLGKVSFRLNNLLGGCNSRIRNAFLYGKSRRMPVQDLTMDLFL